VGINSLNVSLPDGLNPSDFPVVTLTQKQGGYPRTSVSSSYPVKLDGFAAAKIPQAFSVVFQNLDCQTNWTFGIWHGLAPPPICAPYPPLSSIIHYTTGLSRFEPMVWTAADFNRGNDVEYDSEAETASMSLLYFGLFVSGPIPVASGAYVIPVGLIQVEFELTVANPPQALYSWEDMDRVEIALIEIVDVNTNVVIESLVVYSTDFTDINVPTTLTITFRNTRWSTQPLTFRITKKFGNGLIFSKSTVCASTDGSPCATQIPNSCPGTYAPTSQPTGGDTPAPTVCVNEGDCCLYEPCCAGFTCVKFGPGGIFRTCAKYSGPLLTASPTPAPGPPPITAYIRTDFSLDYLFWMANRGNLDYEYSFVVRSAILYYFADAKFGDVIVDRGSVLATIPWKNVPARFNSQIGVIASAILPSTGCFKFPQNFMLNSNNADTASCTVSFLRMCPDGVTLVAWETGVCPTPNPTNTPTTMFPTVVLTDPPSVDQAMGLRDMSLTIAQQASRNANIIIAVVCSLAFLALVLFSIRQFKRQQNLNKAIKDLQTYTDSIYAQSAVSGSSSASLYMSELELSSISEQPVDQNIPPEVQKTMAPYERTNTSNQIKSPPQSPTENGFDNWDSQIRIAKDGPVPILGDDAPAGPSDSVLDVRAFEQAASQSLKRGSKVDFIY